MADKLKEALTKIQEAQNAAGVAREALEDFLSAPKTYRSAEANSVGSIKGALTEAQDFLDYAEDDLESLMRGDK